MVQRLATCVIVLAHEVSHSNADRRRPSVRPSMVAEDLSSAKGRSQHKQQVHFVVTCLVATTLYCASLVTMDPESSQGNAGRSLETHT